MNPEHGVMVTLADVYATQQEMLVTLAKIEGALALSAQTDQVDKATLADHESRLRKVEVKMYALPGAGVVITTAALLWQIVKG